MTYRKTTDRRTVLSLLLALPFALLLIAALIAAIGLLSGYNFGLVGGAPPPATPVPAAATPTEIPRPLARPIADPLTGFRNVGLGLAIDYPTNWRRKATTLYVIFSPSPAGLDRDNLQNTALWIGLPADDTYQPEAVLQKALAYLPETAEITRLGQQSIGGQGWITAQARYTDEDLGGPAMALVAAANRNRVGYMLLATAPADQWETARPIFEAMLTTFRFTEEVVLRPTDATPPPTLTPTPTPIIYVVQPGDTLGAIAVRHDVSVEALSNRNGIDNPRYLRSGQRLIIPPRR